MKNSGLTLVELMVVVVIIGILAGVATPKFKRAADKTKAAEAPQILSAIAGGEEAYRIVNGKYLQLPPNKTSEDAENWTKIGMKFPDSRYFKYYTINVKDGTPPTNETDLLGLGMPPEFTAKAELLFNLSDANANSSYITINEKGEKRATKGLNMLISSFGATSISN